MKKKGRKLKGTKVKEKKNRTKEGIMKAQECQN
jgi:hypothetical protein